MGRPRNTQEDFLRQTKRDPITGCLEWTGKKDPKGYGLFQFTWSEGETNQKDRGDRTKLAHQYSFRKKYGKHDKDGLDHIVCDNPGCCDPDHVIPSDSWENTRRGYSPHSINDRKEKCPKCGGPYSKRKNGRRFCRPCRNQYARDWRSGIVGHLD